MMSMIFFFDNFNSDRRGYSIIELVICLNVITILALVSAPCYQLYKTRANLTAVYLKGKSLSHSYLQFQLDRMENPEDLHSHNLYNSAGKNDWIDRITNPHNAYRFFFSSFSRDYPAAFFHDPFPDRYAEESFLIAVSKKEMNEVFPFQHADRNGCILSSRGPDLQIETISVGFQFNGLVYDNTNGLQSSGDIFLLIPENTPPRFE